MKESQRSTLEKPEEFFVALEEYKKDNPDIEIAPSSIVWEKIDGKWVDGVSCINN